MPPRTPLAALALLGSLVVAGCVAPAAEPPAPAEPLAAQGGEARFAMSATDCEEGGFVAAYNFDLYGSETPTHANWTLADVSEELGNPIHDAMGSPRTGPMFAHWHMGFRCAHAQGTAGEAQDFLWGFVGIAVEEPAWDPGGADMHFLLSGLGFQEGPFLDAMLASTIADVTPAVEARVDWYLPRDLPRSAAYVRYVDAEKGVYEGWGDLMLLREAPERTIRFWWQVPVDGERDGHAHHNGMNTLFGAPEEDAEGAWHPVYWDLRVPAAPQWVTPPETGVQLGSHNMLGFEHGPVPGQPTTSVVYGLESLEFELGGVLEDTVLTLMWNH